MSVSDIRVHQRSGLGFTAIGYGGAPIGNFNGAFTEAEAQETISQAWDQGVRYFDTAPGYGNGLSEYRLGHALREQSSRYPHLWPPGLLQLAMFVGRNKSYLDAALSTTAALSQWKVDDEPAFHERAIATIVDHGMGLPIFPAHRLKTWSAVRAEVASGLPDGARSAMLAAVNRLLAVRFKERHPLRTATQALGFVAKED